MDLNSLTFRFVSGILSCLYLIVAGAMLAKCFRAHLGAAASHLAYGVFFLGAAFVCRTLQWDILVPILRWSKDPDLYAISDIGGWLNVGYTLLGMLAAYHTIKAINLVLASKGPDHD